MCFMKQPDPPINKPDYGLSNSERAVDLTVKPTGSDVKQTLVTPAAPSAPLKAGTKSGTNIKM